VKRNQSVKSSSRIRTAGAAARAARTGRGTHQRSRTPEIIGVASLGVAIFLGAGLLSLQLGDGRLMGPFGRSCAALLYSLAGMGGYAIAAAAGVVAVRLLVGKQPVARAPVVLGVALGVVAFDVLLHLCAARYRVAGYPPGGSLGEGIGEVLRQLVSTAGTALLALVGLVVAVVVATPLRMGQVLEASWKSLRWSGLGMWRGGRRVGGEVAGFTGDVIRAVLPERDRDEYGDEEPEEDHAVDESMVEMEAVAEPPIIDRSGRLVEMSGGDTEKMTGDEVPALVAEDGTTIARKKRKRKKTDLGVGDTMPPKTAVMEVVPAPEPAPSGDGPVIVESQFRHPKKDEMKAKEEKVDANRLGFIPLGDGEFQLPPVNILDYDESQAVSIDRSAMLEMSAKLIQTLENYGIQGQVTAIRPGPVETVYLKEILADDVFQQGKAKLPLALGKDIEGAPVVVDLAKMPHLLVAGATGSGKSVAVNTMITSLLYSATPEDVRFIMVDPKVLELSIYEGVPHLLLPVVTDPKKANLALRWAVEEMERRYDLLARMGVRDIASYNKKLVKVLAKEEAKKLRDAADEAERAAEVEDDFAWEGEKAAEPAQEEMDLDEPPRKLPYIVVVIDEFADLMMCAPKDVETSVARIAQKARAAGIHLMLATQRPSVDVITGLIKANFPSRIAFHVTSKVDSRTILDQMGAENLLGAGDMLFSDRGSAPQRLHGCYVQEEEIGRVVDFLKKQGRPAYNYDILKPREDDDAGGGDEMGDGDDVSDDLYDRAVRIVAETQRVSVSYLQRRLSVGYNRAAKMVERMEKEGVVSPPDVKKVREVLIAPAA